MVVVLVLVLVVVAAVSNKSCYWVELVDMCIAADYNIVVDIVVGVDMAVAVGAVVVKTGR